MLRQYGVFINGYDQGQIQAPDLLKAIELAAVRAENMESDIAIFYMYTLIAFREGGLWKHPPITIFNNSRITQ